MKNKKLIFIMMMTMILVIIPNVYAADNKNIVEGYTYDSSACITGEESTCIKTTCYKNPTEGSCPSGTIIKYKVNDKDTVAFHVLYDNGSTLTMQSVKNTIEKSQWISEEDYKAAYPNQTACTHGFCNDGGPLTALSNLENATAGWDNVNDQTYTMGTTVFKTSPYTKCDHSLKCTENIYTLPERTAKARMITFQEAVDLGCSPISDKSCPYFLAGDNYTEESGYWTMSVVSPDYPTWFICHGARRLNYTSHYSEIAIRAVVVIDKEFTKSSNPEINNSDKTEVNKNDNQVVSVDNTAWNISKIVISIGLAILVIGVMVIVQTFTKPKKKQ